MSHVHLRNQLFTRFDGKLNSFKESLDSGVEYKGDIHIEPHHGTNICFISVVELAQYLLNNPNASVLGNSYYSLYNRQE